MKKIKQLSAIKFLLGAMVLGLFPMKACSSSYLIDSASQVKPGIFTAAFVPYLAPVAASTTTLKSELTAETTTRIAADLAIMNSSAAIVAKLNALDVSTGTLTTKAANIAVDTGTLTTDLGLLSTKVDNIAVDTGTLSSDLGLLSTKVDNIAVDTGTLYGYIVAISTSAAWIQSDNTFLETNHFQTITSANICINNDCKTSWPSGGGDAHLAANQLWSGTNNYNKNIIISSDTSSSSDIVSLEPGISGVSSAAIKLSHNNSYTAKLTADGHNWLAGSLAINAGGQSHAQTLYVIGGGYFASSVTASAFYGDGSGITNLPPSSGDNLGNHIATTTLNMSDQSITAISSMTFLSGISIGANAISLTGVEQNSVAIGGIGGCGGLGSPAVCIGAGTGNDNYYSVNIGGNNSNNEIASINIGQGALNNAANSINIGQENYLNKDSGIALGNHIWSTATNAIAIGNSSFATVGETICIGHNCNNTTPYTAKFSSNYMLKASSASFDGSLQQGTVLGCTLGLTTDANGLIDGCVASDKSLKTDIKTLGTAGSIIDKLNPVNYSWTAKSKRDKGAHAGFIAQEVKAAYPQAVSGAGKGLLGVDPNAINALLVKELQDLRKRVAALEKAKK